MPATAPHPAALARGGFADFAEFARSVKAAALSDRPNERLKQLQQLASPPAAANEGTGADGGFLVPTDFAAAVARRVVSEDSLIGRCDIVRTTSNTIQVPVGESTPWSAGGIQARWLGEGSRIAESVPDIRSRKLKLDKLAALVPVTDELLEDAPALVAYLERSAAEQFDHQLNVALIRGTGVGKPLGLIHSDATLTVAKEAGQPADTINYANVVKMWGRLYAPCRKTAVWIANQDVEPALMQTYLAAGSTAMPTFAPPGVAAAPYATLMGRPIVPSMACPALGDRGDLVLADLTQFLAAMKAGPNPRVDVSMHLWFDIDLTAFRFVMRVAGQSWWSAPVVGSDGVSEYAPAVVLEERS